MRDTIQRMTSWHQKAKALLKAKRVKYADVAEALCVGESAVGHYLNGRREPSIEQVRTIARLAGVSMSELVGEDAYFLVNKSERDLIDDFRGLSQAEREIASRMIHSLRNDQNSDEQSDNDKN